MAGCAGAGTLPGYDENNFIPSLRESLSYEGNVYAVPFYGESSFRMYRKDLCEQAGIEMPHNWPLGSSSLAGWSATNGFG